MRPRTEARFAVGTRAGPRSSIWKAWVHGEEAYLASRAFGKYQKVSLHSSGLGQWSLTDEWAKENPGRRNAERHIVRWTMPTAAEGQAALVFKVQVPCSELRVLPVPTDKKKVFWVSGVPPAGTVRYLFYLTGACADDPAPQDTEYRRKLFSLKFRSERWMVALLDVTSLSTTDLLAARQAVIEQFLPNASLLELKEMRASIFSQPNEPLSDCHGLIEMCLTEA